MQPTDHGVKHWLPGTDGLYMMGELRVVLCRDLTMLGELRQPHPVGIEACGRNSPGAELQASNTESRRSPALQKAGQACRGGYFRPVTSHPHLVRIKAFGKDNGRQGRGR